MALFHEMNNHYQINDIAGWPALFKRLQESSGQPLVDSARAYCYDVGGEANPKHFYDIRLKGTDTGGVESRWLEVSLGGKDLINDPMHNLRSAEELIETMITLREFNTKPGREFNGEVQVAVDDRLKDPTTATNFYVIVNEAKHHQLIEQLIAAGADHNDHQTSFGFSLMGHGDRYNIDIQKRDGLLGIIVLLNGHDVLNIGVPKLYNAEDILESILLANNSASFGSEKADGLKDPVADLGVNTEVQRHTFEVGESTINNFFQVYDPLSWLETVGAFQAEHDLNLDSGEVIHIKTSRDGIETGVYTIQKVIIGDKAGVQVNQDGHPFWNYGKPQTSTAEQVVALIEKLRKNFGSIPIGKEFNFNPDNSKPLVASVKNGKTEVKLFANGTITIYHPGLVAWNAPGSDVVMLEGLAETLESHLAAPGRDVDE